MPPFCMTSVNPSTEEIVVSTRQKLRFVLPSRNEGPNVGPMLRVLNEIAGNMPTIDVSVRFIDDSDPDHVDATTVAYEQLIEDEEFSYLDSHACVFRPEGERWGRLGGAVVDGLMQARSEGITFVISGDVDGQHPFKESVPYMLKQLQDYGGLVGASRYVKGGSNEGLGGFYRKAVSRTSTVLARGLFPVAHRNVTDPMSGFFGLELAKFDLERLRDVYGFKILFEIVATHRREIAQGIIPVAQIPIRFLRREAGSSKADRANGKAFLQQAKRLRLDAWPAWFKFALVGGIGFVVQSSLLEIFYQAGVAAVPAFGMALVITVAYSLKLSRFIWQGEQAAPKTWRRSLIFWTGRLLAAVLCLVAFDQMVWMGIRHHVASAICIILGVMITYPTSRLALRAGATPEEIQPLAATPALVNSNDREHSMR